ncbi:MAG: cell envelope integrity protein TolA [Deltaproteobacteria bacterium]|nr:cell envelope integrity protein TolA [Deltaproteobacteria bacterium]
MAKSRPPLFSFDESGSLLWKCIVYSGVLHAGLIWTLWVVPHLPARKMPAYPVYTVELVGGEKLGGTVLGTELQRGQKKKAEKVKAEPVRKEPAKKETAKKEVVVQEPAKKAAPKKEESKPVERPAAMREIVKSEKAKPKVKEEAQPAESLPGSVREKLIQAAVDRARERAEASRKAEAGKEALAKAEKQPMSAGPGEGVGAAAPGSGGSGGGIVKAFEFLVYRNQMLRLIRDRWTWVGKRGDLEVTVRFGIRDNGQIAGLRILRASGDPSYDDSVMRAVAKASPLPPPPENYRKEFMDVELTFRPKDLGG